MTRTAQPWTLNPPASSEELPFPGDYGEEFRPDDLGEQYQPDVIPDPGPRLPVPLLGTVAWPSSVTGSGAVSIPAGETRRVGMDPRQPQAVLMLLYASAAGLEVVATDGSRGPGFPVPATATGVPLSLPVPSVVLYNSTGGALTAYYCAAGHNRS